MSKRTAFKPGQVIRAKVPDRGGNAKLRPLLVIEPAPASSQSQLCCLAISTDPKEDPTDPAVELPWDASGAAPTGLREWCRVVLLWHVQVEQDEAKLLGAVDPVLLADVMAKRQHVLDYRTPPP